MASRKKFHTVDAIHKLGSYPVPKEGRSVATMDKITTQELQGAIVVEAAQSNPCRTKCLGFLLDQIFSDFTTAISVPSPEDLVVPRNVISRYHPQIAQRYPSNNSVPLYDKDAKAWNWPLPEDATPPLDKDDKGGWQENHLSTFFNAVASALKPAIAKQTDALKERHWLGSYSTRRIPGKVDGAGAYHRKPDLILIETGICSFNRELDVFSSKP